MLKESLSQQRHLAKYAEQSVKLMACFLSWCGFTRDAMQYVIAIRDAVMQDAIAIRDARRHAVQLAAHRSKRHWS